MPVTRAGRIRRAVARRALGLLRTGCSAITPDTDPPDDIGDIIVTLEQLAGEDLADLELAELPRAAGPRDETSDD